MITYELPENGFVTIKIYDISGRLVKVITNEYMQAGSHAMMWDGTDSRGNIVAAGVYFCTVEFTTDTGDIYMQSIKMSLEK